MVQGPGYVDSLSYSERTPITFQARIDTTTFGLSLIKRAGLPVEIDVDGNREDGHGAIGMLISLLESARYQFPEDEQASTVE